MNNPFPYAKDNKRYHTWSHHLKETFGRKTAKVALDAGFTCPNLDGTRGEGGCSYCAGGPPCALPLGEQYRMGREAQLRKWPEAKTLAYLQARTNTYAPVSRLEAVYNEALSFPGVAGLCVATRADCLPPETVELLARMARRTWLVVELGLQTVHEETAARMNRLHSYREFLEGYGRLQEAGIRTCVHLINGLPGESKEMMLRSAEEVGRLRPHSVKIHMLHLLRGTPLAEEYARSPFPLPGRENYVELICDQLELLPPEVVVQRLTGDPPRDLLVAPLWTPDKRRTLNAVDRELARRDSWQGKGLETTR